MIEVQTSYGELVDKLTIVEIKMSKITDAEKLALLARERSVLEQKYDTFRDQNTDTLKSTLRGANEKLWGLEDSIRKEIKENNLEQVSSLAIQVCRTNDYRFEVKRQINLLLDSQIQEVKEHIEY